MAKIVPVPFFYKALALNKIWYAIKQKNQTNLFFLFWYWLKFEVGNFYNMSLCLHVCDILLFN